MAEPIQLRAGESIRSLWGHAILVDGHRLHVGQQGHLTAPPSIAERLLAQSGWVAYDGDNAAANGCRESGQQQAIHRGSSGRGRRKKRR